MKQKTHKGTAKRVKISGSGKVQFAKACRRHLLSSKGAQLKKAGQNVQAPKGHMQQLSRLLNIAK